MKNHKNDPSPRNFFQKIAATPDRSSYIWKDGQPSILSIVILWAVWVCRLFSLLQWCKAIRRLFGYLKQEIDNKRQKVHEQRVEIVDKGSNRRNIPPYFPEVYFLIWLGIMMVFYFLALQSTVVKVFTYYYLFESITWVAYYTIFRRFFEEKYSLYHSLENLVLLILLFITQMFAFTNLLRDVPDIENDLFQNLLGLLGASWDKTHPVVKLCGAFNAAIVIGMIISNFPSERTKSDIDSEQFIIIGNGDVVRNRLRPAIKKAKFKSPYINTYDLIGENYETGKHIYNCESPTSIVEKVSRRINGKTVLFLCSPSFSHYYYIDELYHRNYSLFVDEKPISSNVKELVSTFLSTGLLSFSIE